MLVFLVFFDENTARRRAARMVGENEGDGQVMPSYGSYPITISGRGYPAFCDDGHTRKPKSSMLMVLCRLHADSRAERDVRVFGRFNGAEQDGHGEIRMVVSLGDEPRFYPAWRPVVLTKDDEAGAPARWAKTYPT